MQRQRGRETLAKNGLASWASPPPREGTAATGLKSRLAEAPIPPGRVRKTLQSGLGSRKKYVHASQRDPEMKHNFEPLIRGAGAVLHQHRLIELQEVVPVGEDPPLHVPGLLHPRDQGRGSVGGGGADRVGANAVGAKSVPTQLAAAWEGGPRNASPPALRNAPASSFDAPRPWQGRKRECGEERLGLPRCESESGNSSSNKHCPPQVWTDFGDWLFTHLSNKSHGCCAVLLSASPCVPC